MLTLKDTNSLLCRHLLIFTSVTSLSECTMADTMLTAFLLTWLFQVVLTKDRCCACCFHLPSYTFLFILTPRITASYILLISSEKIYEKGTKSKEGFLLLCFFSQYKIQIFKKKKKTTRVTSGFMEVYGNLRDLDRARISHCIFLPQLPPQICKLFPLLAQPYLFSMYPL